MKQLAASFVMFWFAAVPVFAADQTWIGKISDSTCGLSHKPMEHGDKTATDRSCLEACMKHGAKYVFTSKGKVYTIANQSDVDLASHVGQTAMLVGEMKGQGIAVSQILGSTRKGKE
jgi:hypothetical protein